MEWFRWCSNSWRLYLITGLRLIVVCGWLCTQSLARHPRATNPQCVQELLELYRTNCRCFGGSVMWELWEFGLLHDVFELLWLTQVGGVFFVMEADLLINSDVTNIQLMWLISRFCCLHHNHCVSLSCWKACNTADRCRCSPACNRNDNLFYRQ